MNFYSIPRRFPGRMKHSAMLAALLATALSAHAALDGDASSLLADQQALKANTVSHLLGSRFVVHTMALQNGTVMREYLSQSGNVFGVTWSGRSIPDFRQILGVHYADFAASPYRQRGGVAHLVVRDNLTNPNLVVESHGQMDRLHGRAYLLQKLPVGVSTADIQ